MKSKSIFSVQMSRCILLSETHHICIFCIKHKITLSLHSKINFLLQWFKFSTSTKCNFKISMLNFSAKVQIQINILSKVTSQIHSSLCTIFQSFSTLCKFLGDLTLTQCRILEASGKLRCANILWVHSFRCTWLLTGVPNKKNKSYLFDETTFLGTSRSKLFPSEVLIVSNISLQCVLKLAENWEKQFQAGVTNQVFCNKVVFLASFKLAKSVLCNGRFEFKRLQSLKHKMKLLSNMHKKLFLWSLQQWEAAGKKRALWRLVILKNCGLSLWKE